MNESRYFTEHWQTIEEERIKRYEQMFVWRQDHIQLLNPLDLQPGHQVLDYGCGPGFMSEGMAEIVGTNGHVYGVDLNQRFVDKANDRVHALGHVSFHLIQGDSIPLENDSVDRVFCKNVLEYVPSLQTTLAELARVLRPDGKFLIIDSDWHFVFVEPWGRATTERFFNAASIAFKTPEIGRSLKRKLKQANFNVKDVRISAGVDTTGGSLSVLRNMASYIKEFERLAAADVDQLILDAEQAIEKDDYMFCLPQFIVNGNMNLQS